MKTVDNADFKLKQEDRFQRGYKVEGQDQFSWEVLEIEAQLYD